MHEKPGRFTDTRTPDAENGSGPRPRAVAQSSACEVEIGGRAVGRRVAEGDAAWRATRKARPITTASFSRPLSRRDERQG